MSDDKSKEFYITYNGKISQRNINILLQCIQKHLDNGYGNPYLFLCSEGGDINAALHAYNYLTSQSNSFFVTTHNTGACGSAANIVFLSGEKRYACENSYFWFHEITLPLQKDMALKRSQAMDFVNATARLEQIALSIYNSKMTIEENDLWKYHLCDTCITPEKATANNLINAIREIPFLGNHQESLGEDQSHLHIVLELD